LAGAQAFHFPAGQGPAGLGLLFGEIVVERLFVQRDGARVLFLLLRHRARLMGTGGGGGRRSCTVSRTMLRARAEHTPRGGPANPRQCARVRAPPGRQFVERLCMTTHTQRSALLPYPARALNDLVNDVASYPQFLPWCSTSEVLEESE